MAWGRGGRRPRGLGEAGEAGGSKGGPHGRPVHARGGGEGVGTLGARGGPAAPDPAAPASGPGGAGRAAAKMAGGRPAAAEPTTPASRQDGGKPAASWQGGERPNPGGGRPAAPRQGGERPNPGGGRPAAPRQGGERPGAPDPAAPATDPTADSDERQLFKRNLSGNLAPEVSLLARLKTLDFMWNNLTGNIPKEIGNITTLKLILLNGNQLSGFLPDEIGNLQNLNRLQVDQNMLSGPIPKSFANLTSVKHLHMNNNSLSGQIPPELSRLPRLVHLLVDNNNLSGPLPPELAGAKALKILQVDNNNFSGSSIPPLYSNISTLFKLSLRNCSLQGAIPDLSAIPQLGYLDLSWNQLTGSIPTNKLASNITTIDLSHNMLNGTIPSNFSGLPNLQLLSVENNLLDGSVPLTIWNGVNLTGNRSLVLDFQNNSLKMFLDEINPPPNVTVLLNGNPVCKNSSGSLISDLCLPRSINQQTSKQELGTTLQCGGCPTDKTYEHNPSLPGECFCLVPLGVGLRLKSPGVTDFHPYEFAFKIDITSKLQLFQYQLYIENYIWEVGPRLNMQLKLFPSNTSLFNKSEVVRLRHVLAGWEITLLDVFGPYELLNFTLGSYESDYPDIASSGLSKVALGSILAGTIVGAIALSAVATALIMRRRHSRNNTISRRSLSRFSVKTDGMRCFAYEEMAAATNNFDLSAQVGQGGYGIVYKGILADGTIVAIKRAHEDSLQGSKEFCTEIELLSRLHHRNLVALVGYCDEENEQMLVYEFMSNGTLRDNLSGKHMGSSVINYFYSSFRCSVGVSNPTHLWPS
ncbi:hypothetical protein GUJ93_ZPchr0005g15199 [Zizania palustris]|uniref:non-specific serine/threonine protein kinase n=1 Tax=Zizania palustris TaxID=103762 RepID=A0A8J5T8L6_ZIZPA|nr:hypothetical protein GUJ93_ZPchr0005g15199 [Zizania palustris]